MALTTGWTMAAAAASVLPPVTVEAMALPVVPVRLPRKALAITSPAWTWKAVVGDVKARCVPLASVTAEATTLAFLNAVAAGELPLPAAWMPAFTAATRVSMSVTPLRLMEAATLVASEKPGPAKYRVEAPPTWVVLPVSVRICSTVWVFEASPMSAVPPMACMPVSPRLRASTVEPVRFMFTVPLEVLNEPVPAALPPPTYTASEVANCPPVFRPMACAWRLISPSRLWNSPFGTVREPVNVSEADWVARVRRRSNIWEMLFMPPSMICRVLMPSLALRTPWVTSATELR